MEALEEFLNLFIQSETNASTHEYSESNHASKYVMLLSNVVDEHQLVLVPLTCIIKQYQELFTKYVLPV